MTWPRLTVMWSLCDLNVDEYIILWSWWTKIANKYSQLGTSEQVKYSGDDEEVVWYCHKHLYHYHYHCQQQNVCFKWGCITVCILVFMCVVVVGAREWSFCFCSLLFMLCRWLEKQWWRALACSAGCPESFHWWSSICCWLNLSLALNFLFYTM